MFQTSKNLTRWGTRLSSQYRSCLHSSTLVNSQNYIRCVSRWNSSTSSTPSPPSSGFPGAPNSSFTQELSFQRNWPIISTYRILDTEGMVLNGAVEPEIENEVLIKMYKSMITLNVWFLKRLKLVWS